MPRRGYIWRNAVQTIPGRPAIGDCIYCKRPAGFLRRSHWECKQAHDVGVRRIEKLVRRRDLAPGEAAGQIVRIARKARVSHALKPALVSGWTSAVSAALAQGGVDNSEEARLDSLLAHFDISRNKIDRGKLWRKVQAKRAQVAGERVERTQSAPVQGRSNAVTTFATGCQGAMQAPVLLTASPINPWSAAMRA